MECFAIIVNGLQSLTTITKHSILDVAAVLHPPLNAIYILSSRHHCQRFFTIIFRIFSHVCFLRLTKNYLYLLNLFLRDMSCSNNWADFARSYLANIYLFKVNNGNTMQCVKFVQLTIKGPDRGHWRRSGVFTVNCEQISDTVLVVSIVEFEQVYASWEIVKGRMRCEIFLSRHFMKY